MGINYKTFARKSGQSTIVKPCKRTLIVQRQTYNHPSLILFKGMFHFPKIMFHQFYINNSKVSYAHGINDKDEICHLPFFNINEHGKICIDPEDAETMDKLIDSFYTQPFNYCVDSFSGSIRKYIKYYEGFENRTDHGEIPMDWSEYDEYFNHDDVINFYKTFKLEKLVPHEPS